MDLILDINSWLYPMELGELLLLIFTSFLFFRFLVMLLWSELRKYIIYASGIDEST